MENVEEMLKQVLAEQKSTKDQLELLTTRLGVRTESRANGLRAQVEKARGSDGRIVVSNSEKISAAKEPTLMDNVLLFLPPRAAYDLGLEPNMDDKGDREKELWYGRVWELRALLGIQYRAKLQEIKDAESCISEERKQELKEKMEDPAMRFKLIKMVAKMKGVVFRDHCGLGMLNRLSFSNLRGILVYCHGSGGCSWDNFRICRMCAAMGMLVIAPDDFAYPDNTAMGQLRHKDLLPLKKATDNVDYWTGDLMYSSGSEGELTYSTKAESVLEDPDGYREKYEKCYQLRRSEMHFVINHLPLWIKTKGFFLGGTSEGGMTVARFDDQRYGAMVCGRFINSFSVEYCYFTPKEEDGQLGGQLDVPTLNIIGTKDQYFGPEDSVAKLVAEDETTGYGDKDLTGNAYNTFKKQGVECGLVCVLEAGVHSPCNTHDNFLRQLFDHFFTRPGSIWELDAIWAANSTMKDLIQVTASTEEEDTMCNIVQLFVPRMKFPQHMSLRQVEAMRHYSNYAEKIQEMMAEEEKAAQADQEEAKNMLNSIRQHMKKEGGEGFAATMPGDIEAKKGDFKGVNFYESDKVTAVHYHKRKHH
mmetsp:Transcript_89556/g.261766  ORF Transcript_89556/g.261766 Transcript_89556/m.261766 type:complete len:588 (+) Transcript_89556:80-1843(+)